MFMLPMLNLMIFGAIVRFLTFRAIEISLFGADFATLHDQQCFIIMIL